MLLHNWLYPFIAVTEQNLEVNTMSRLKVLIPIFIIAVIVGALLYKYASTSIADAIDGAIPLAKDTQSISLIANPKTAAEKIVNGAKKEAINEVVYNAEYFSIPYPNGDVPASQGACTEVVIRGLRNAGYDLQKLVHEDMSSNFQRYPRRWGLKRTDSSIDHRRVRNLMVFFHRKGMDLTVRTDGNYARAWKPGDIVCWDLNGNGLTHTGILSDVKGSDGLPMIIHNIGPVATEEEGLTNWRIIGHYRYPKP
jgi:uncharacterized protein YijF (DUF1287 family)